MNPGAQRIVDLLGYAGLIPFVLPAIYVWVSDEHVALAVTIGNAYAFGIICFLTGSWWGLALHSGSQRLLWLSNLYFLVAFFIFLFAAAWWALAAAILLMSIFFAEQNTSLFSQLTTRYRRIRTILTSVAAASMLAIHLGA